MTMGRPFPKVSRSAAEWGDVLVRACLIFALGMVAAALHPLVLVFYITVMLALIDEKTNWLKSRLDRSEDVARAERLKRSAGRIVRNV